MYDNINIQFENAESIITRTNALWHIIKLSYRIKKYGATPQNYAFLAHAYDYLSILFFNKWTTYMSFKYALKSIKLDKNYAYAYYIAADTLVGTGHQDKSLKYLTKAEELYKDKKDKFFGLIIVKALIFMLQNKNLELRNTAEKYLSLECDYPEYYIGKLILKAHPCLDNIIDWSTLGQYFKSSLKYHIIPDIHVLWMVGMLCSWVISSVFFPLSWLSANAEYYSEQKRDDKIFNLFVERAKKMKLLKMFIYCSLLYFYYQNDEYEKCIAGANRFLLEEKQNVFYMYKAMSYGYLGDIKQSLKNFELSKKGKTDYGFLINFIDKVFFKSFLTKHNTSFDYWIAKFYYIDENYKEALRYINKELMTCRDFSNYRLKGMAYYRLEKYQESIECFKKAIECDKKNEEIYNAYGWIAWNYYLLKDFNSALVYIDFSLMEHPTAEHYEIKGDILWARGEGKLADKYYKLASKKAKEEEEGKKD